MLVYCQLLAYLRKIIAVTNYRLHCLMSCCCIKSKNVQGDNRSTQYCITVLKFPFLIGNNFHKVIQNCSSLEVLITDTDRRTHHCQQEFLEGLSQATPTLDDHSMYSCSGSLPSDLEDVSFIFIPSMQYSRLVDRLYYSPSLIDPKTRQITENEEDLNSTHCKIYN